MLASIYPTTDNDDSIPLQIYHCALLPSTTLRHHTNANQRKRCKKYKYNGVQILEIWCRVFRHPSLSVSPTPHPTPPLPHSTCVGLLASHNAMPPILCHVTCTVIPTVPVVPGQGSLLLRPSQTESYHFFGIFLLIKNQHHLSVTCVLKRAFYLFI